MSSEDGKDSGQVKSRIEVANGEDPWLIRGCYADSKMVITGTNRSVGATAVMRPDGGESLDRGVALHDRGALCRS